MEFLTEITLYIMNFVLIILFAFTLAFIIYSYNKNVKMMKSQQDDINNLISYIRYYDKLLVDLIILLEKNNKDIDAIKIKSNEIKNLMDLDEFKNITQELKDKYKKYMVNQLMAGIVPLINKQSKNESLSDKNLQIMVNDILGQLHTMV